MPKKLIKKYNDGGTSGTTSAPPLIANLATVDYAKSWLDSQVVPPAPINPAPPVVSNPYDYGTAAYNGFEILSHLNDLSGEKLEKFNKSLDSRRGQSSINIGNMAKGMGVNMGASYLGGLLGNAFGGEVGNAVGAIASNFGSTVGNTLLNRGTLAGGLKNFTSLSNLGNLAGGIATGILDRSTAHQRTSGKYGTLAAGVDTASPLINTVFGTSNPYGMVGSVGMAAINKITGGTDGMTIVDSLLGSSGVAGALFAANPLVGAGYMALSGINSATGQTTEKNLGNDFLSKEDLAELWGSYSKSNKDHRVASKYGGKKYGGISVLTGSFGRANDKVIADNQRINTLMNIHDNRELGQIRGQAMADINSLDYRLNTFGGYDLYGTRIGRKGMKLPTKLDIDKIKTILNSKKDIEQFKKGGQMSVIPEGALHARLHHLEGIDNITKKGIPVVDKSGEQQAEIERNEIIFSLEVTNKLEQLRKDGSDKAAIEAGKLLVEEIFHNTDDRTGLIQEVIETNEAKKPAFKDGGTILAEKPMFIIEAEEPEIEKFQEGGDIILTGEKPTTPTNKPRVPIFIIDATPRTDILNGIIYYNTPESKIHEYYGHYNPNLMLMKLLASYWTDLNDDKLKEFGTDLLFVKRFENDPGHFFNPEEVLGRIEAARYMLGKDIYNISPQFFIDLKENDELKYGDNLRDLLHMYSPQILTEIFRKARLHMNPKLQEGGIIKAEEPSNNEEEVELFQEGGMIESSIEKKIEGFANGDKIHLHFVYKPRLKPKYEDWIKDVNPEYLSDNYDMKMAYEVLPFEQLERWKFGVNSNDPKYYMDYQDNNGIYTYHLPSVAELDNGDFIFLKKGTESVNPELHFETDMYHNGENGFKNTHDLKFEGDRYYYRKKKSSKKEDGGIVDQINKLSPDKILELENILKYLNQ